MIGLGLGSARFTSDWITSIVSYPHCTYSGGRVAQQEAKGLLYAPIPASVDFCTIGGNVATNAGGLCAVKYGVTRQHVLALEAVLASGEVIRAGKNVVIPPVTAPQRRFGKVLGRYRLNLGGGYALHGTQAVDQLGRAVSHGCVRLAYDRES